MRLLDTRILSAALLIFCTASGCSCRPHHLRPHHVSQCGQGHSSLLDCYLSKTNPHYHHNHHGQGPCTEEPCAGAPCDADCYQRPVAPQTVEPRNSAPQQQSAPVPPSESTTRIIRPRRRWIDRTRDSLNFSIPLPSRWIGSTEPAAEVSEPEEEEEIPWNNEPVATATETETAIANPNAPQVVGYEYGVPVELQAPRFDETDIAAGHSLSTQR